MNKLGRLVAISFFLSAIVASAAESEPRVFSVLPGSLAGAKVRAVADDPALKPAL